MGAEDDELAVRHEDAGGLPGADAAEEGVHGAEERDEVLLALLGVEAEQLAVPGADGGGRGEAGGRVRRGGRGHAGVLVRDPLCDVVLHGFDHFLLQLLELIDL